jgi:ankyrin repeat protein
MMPAYLDVLLTTKGILQRFKKDVVEFESKNALSRSTKETGLRRLKDQLTQCFFDKSRTPMSHEIASHPHVKVYPQLSRTLEIIDALDSTDETSLKIVTEQLESMPPDWNAYGSNAYFERLNARLGYFKPPADLLALNNLFNALAIACRASIVILEGNETVSDADVYDAAYAMMAFCIKENQAAPKLEDLMKSVNRILESRDKRTTKPLQDVFLHVNLPISSEIKDRNGWFNLIQKEGARALPFFIEASKIQGKTKENKAPQTIRDALAAAALVKYARGAKDPDFATLCYSYDRPGQDEDAENGGRLEAVFNKSLDFMATGWPKKTMDTLPNLTVKGDAAAGYYWVKLPPSDKRALILGKITDCCQSMGGHSEQCVKDGVSLEDNGFYVLLKHKRGDGSKPTDGDGRIHYDNFQIIGQSYAWKSREGDLCLDSIECLSNSIPNDVLKHLITGFAQQVLATDSTIRRVHIGQGGKTPKDLFPETNTALQMKQGVMYNDAQTQYVIAESPDFILEENPALRFQWSTWQAEHLEMNEDPCRFLMFLKQLPREQLTDVLQLRDASNGRRLFDHAALGVLPFDVRDVLDCYGDDAARMHAVTLKDKLGQTVLHVAARSPEPLRALLSLYPEGAKLAAVQVKDHHGHTVFHCAANNPESLKIILALYPESERLAAVKEQDSNGDTVLHCAASYLESLKIILELLPESDRLAAVKEENAKGNTLLHCAVNDPESLKTILALLPKSDRVAAVKEKNSNGNTLLHLAAENPESLKTILALYPKSDRVAAVNEKNAKGDTLLHCAASYLESLKIILEPLPESDRVAAVKEKNSDGDTLLHCTAKNPESLKTILALYLESDRLAAVKEKNSDGDTLLHCAGDNPESLKTILALLPESDRVAAVKEKNSNGNTLLHCAAENPESLKTILALYPESERLAAVKEKNSDGETVLHCAAKNPEPLKTILALLPESDRVAAVKEKNSNGNTLLHCAAENPESLKSLLELLPESDRVAAVKVKNSDGSTVLYWAADNPESLKITLALYPESERLAAVKEKTYGRTVLQSAYNPKSLKTLLELLPIHDLLILSAGDEHAFIDFDILKKVVVSKATELNCSPDQVDSIHNADSRAVLQLRLNQISQANFKKRMPSDPNDSTNQSSGPRFQ